MATLRPVTRIISRRLFTSPIITTATTTTPFLRTTPTQTIKLNNHLLRHKSDSASSIPANDRPVPVPGPSTSADISTTDSGAYKRSPGSPAPDSHLESGIAKSTIYTFEEIQSLSESPSPSSKVLLIDVREPSELLGTGKIPGAKNVPISTSPDGFFLDAEEFEDRYGFEKPDSSVEVVFYCKAGVRSKAAARLAGQAGFGGKVGEFPGSWAEWVAKGGKIEQI